MNPILLPLVFGLVVAAGGLASKAMAEAPPNSLRGNEDIPTRKIAIELPPSFWRELRDKPYNIYLQAKVDVRSDAKVEVYEVLEQYPEGVSEQVIHILSERVRLELPEVGSRKPRQAKLHLMIYGETSRGVVALVLARGINMPANGTSDFAPEFVQLLRLAPAEPKP